MSKTISKRASIPRSTPSPKTTKPKSAPPGLSGLEDLGRRTRRRPGPAALVDQLSPQLKLRIIEDMFKPLREGMPPLGFTEVVAQFCTLPLANGGKPKALSTRVLKEILKEVFLEKWMVIESRPITPPYAKNSQEADDLMALMSIRIPGFDPNSLIVISGKSPQTDRQSHRQVGKELAKRLRNEVRNKDTILVSSGRTAFYCVQSCSTLNEQFKAKEISIASLTGSVFADGTSAVAEDDDEHDEIGVKFSLDADSLLSGLAVVFKGKYRIYPALQKIAADTPKKRIEILEKQDFRALLTENVDSPQNVHALTGLGVVIGSHRLYCTVTDPTGRRLPSSDIQASVRSIAKWLIPLANKIDHVHKYHVTYFPVADIANRLWVVEPPSNLDSRVVKDFIGTRTPARWEDAEGRAEIEELMKKNANELNITQLVSIINAHLVTVTKSDLKRVNVLLGAATSLKARPLLNLIAHSPEMVKHLVLYMDTVEEMMKILRKEPEWFERIAKRVLTS